MKADIRPARSDDIEQLVALLQQLFGIEEDFDCDPDRQRRGLELLLADRQAGFVLVAEHRERVVAMCTVQKLVSTAEGGYVGLLEDVVVDSNFRGQGIGGRLLSAAEHTARSEGLTRLQLLADRNNRAALDFYDGKAWKRTELIGLRKLLPADGFDE